MTEPHPDALTDEALTSAMSLASLAADGRYADVNALIVALDPSEYGRLIFAFASLAALAVWNQGFSLLQNLHKPRSNDRCTGY